MVRNLGKTRGVDANAATPGYGKGVSGCAQRASGVDPKAAPFSGGKRPGMKPGGRAMRSKGSKGY